MSSGAPFIITKPANHDPLLGVGLITPGSADNMSLQGDADYWPTEPKHTLDVQAFDSPLVLPTRGDVHMLS